MCNLISDTECFRFNVIASYKHIRYCRRDGCSVHFTCFEFYDYSITLLIIIKTKKNQFFFSRIILECFTYKVEYVVPLLNRTALYKIKYNYNVQHLNLEFCFKLYLISDIYLYITLYLKHQVKFKLCSCRILSERYCIFKMLTFTSV